MRARAEKRDENSTLKNTFGTGCGRARDAPPADCCLSRHPTERVPTPDRARPERVPRVKSMTMKRRKSALGTRRYVLSPTNAKKKKRDNRSRNNLFGKPRPIAYRLHHQEGVGR
jgi:hypothetical protein